MIPFWLAAAGMSVLALAMVLPAMVRGRQPESGQERAARSASDYVAVAAVTLLVPALAVGLYYKLGSVDMLSAPATEALAGDDGKLPPVEVLVERLEERMAQAPDDPRGWQMLGQSYIAMGRFAEAKEAYSKALELMGEEPTILVRLAEATARAAGGNLAGEPTALIDRALSLEPNNPDGLWLGGLAAYQRGDGATTLAYWRRLQAMQPADSESATQLEQHIARAESEFQGNTATAAASPPTATTETAGTTIEAHVRLAPELAADVAPGDILFVYARAANGPKMPLALVRRTVADLPLTVRLDDSMAMIPDMTLSSFAEVEVIARVSKAGAATPRPGDLTGSSPPLSVGANQITEVVISRIVE